MWDNSPDSNAVCTRSVSTNETNDPLPCWEAIASERPGTWTSARSFDSTGRLPRRFPPAAELRPVAERVVEAGTGVSSSSLTCAAGMTARDSVSIFS